MSDLKICRICLRTEAKMYNFNRYQLKFYYEEVMVSKVNEEDGLPRHFCYECATILNKFHKFKEKCYTGQNILREMLWRGPIRLKSVRCIRRQAKYLQSSLNLITVSHRVKTTVIKSKETPKLNKVEPTELDLETASISDYDDYVDADNEKEELPSLSELVDIGTNVEKDNEKININEEKTDGDYEKVDLVHEKIDIVLAKGNIDDKKTIIDEDEIEVTEDILKINKELSGDEKLVSDDEILFLDDLKIPTDNEEFNEKESLPVNAKKKKNAKGCIQKKNDADTSRKTKKFEITNKKKTELDPKNWLKFNLSEEEALEEFKARAQHKRFISAQYKCNDCLKGFSKADMLNRHLKLRHNESVGSIECRFCHMRFKWKWLLRTHMRQHYSKFKCLRCDLVCPLETTALFHEDYHNGVIRKCKHCNKEFTHKTTYYTHLRTHRSEHVCTLCGASFVSATGLGIHRKIKHINMGETHGVQEEEYCKRCDIKFENKKAFEEHLIHSAMHVDGIEDLEGPDMLGRIPRKRPRIPTDCRICGKHFSTQNACRKHHLAEHPGTSFAAPEERQICEICGISLVPGSVASHLNTHTREKLHSCSTCGRQFNSRGGMTKHQLTHTDEKPVACTLCDKRFKQKTSMQLHYRTFHLKEPYPKRNRKRKSDEVTKLDEYPHEESDDNIPLDRWR